jgi:hypothetical protein
MRREALDERGSPGSKGSGVVEYLSGSREKNSLSMKKDQRQSFLGYQDGRVDY